MIGVTGLQDIFMIGLCPRVTGVNALLPYLDRLEIPVKNGTGSYLVWTTFFLSIQGSKLVLEILDRKEKGRKTDLSNKNILSYLRLRYYT